MSGLARYAAILRLFDEGASEWTVPDMATALGVPASTVYRTVRDLVTEQFLEPAIEGHYRLGSAFVAFDRLIRVTDPIMGAGQALLRDLALQARVPCVVVLARLYGDRVMCIADVVTPDEKVKTSYERGRPRPLTRGATSKAILAQVPARRLNGLLASEAEGVRHPHAAAATDLRDELALIRKRGYCVSRGEVDAGVVGLAAPVAAPERALIASLSLVVPATALDQPTERRLILLIVSAASLLTETLSASEVPQAARRSAAR